MRVARRATRLTLTVLVIACAAAPGWSQELAQVDRVDEPAPFSGLENKLKDLPPFLRDTRFILHLRTFYQNVETKAGTGTKPGTYQEAWAGGGWLAMESGWLLDTFSVGATGFTSQALYAPASREGTLLLEPTAQGFSVLGEAWAKLRYEDNELTGYRQLVDVGYLNPYDSRMVPNTFEGATLAGKFRWLQYTAGYLTQMKPRNEDSFISMSEAAGASPKTNDGAAVGGFRLQPWPSLTVDANTVFAVNTFNTAFLLSQYAHAFSDDVTLTLGVQYTDQRSVGSELIGSFQTWTVGAKATLDFYGASIAPTFHRTGSGNNIQTPFGRWPGYLKMITKDFDLARQTAAGIRLSYDFGRIHLAGLTGRFSFASGMDALNPKNGKPEPDEREYDFDVIYAPPEGWLSGFSFRVRTGLVEQSGTHGLLPDIRLIMDYEIPVLRGALVRRIQEWWKQD